MNTYDLGKQIRGFLQGLTEADGKPAPAPAPAPDQWGDNSGAGTDVYGDRFQPLDLNQFAIASNQAAKLRPGWLLALFQGTGTLYQIDPASGETEWLARMVHPKSPIFWHAVPSPDGWIYVTVSGRATSDGHLAGYRFGGNGAVLRVKVRGQALEVVAGGPLIDPDGIELWGDDHLLVTDFGGFGGTGTIYLIHKHTSSMRALVTGGLLADPSTSVSPDGKTLYVANAALMYTNRVADGDKDSGNLLRIDLATGRQESILHASDPPVGAIVGVSLLRPPGELLAVRNDWPALEGSSLFLVDGASGDSRVLAQSTEEAPRFFSTRAAVNGDVAWVADSYMKQLLVLRRGKAGWSFDGETVPIKGVWMASRGLPSSMDVMESLAFIS